MINFLVENENVKTLIKKATIIIQKNLILFTI